MKLTFRQGLVRVQKDSANNITFLQKSNNDVNIFVTDTPTLVSFAHRESTYLIEETRSNTNAWKNLTGNTKKFLYWDIDLLTAKVSYGFTTVQPTSSLTQPANPVLDQHWFDMNSYFYKVWNGKKWVEKIRCFAGTLLASGNLVPQNIGSQVNILGEYEAGFILLDSFGNPLRQRNPQEPASVTARFVTSASWLGVTNYGASTIRLEENTVISSAYENLPKYSLVQQMPSNRVQLARSGDHGTRILGIVLQDVLQNSPASITTTGKILLSNNVFTNQDIKKPVFCSVNGELTLTPPVTGVLQQVGNVLDTNSFMLDIKQPVILSETTSSSNIGFPTTGFNFTLSPANGSAPITITATYTGSGAELVEWDFNNDGFWDATGPSATFTYQTPGKYSIKQRVTNQNGSDETTMQDAVNVTSSATNTNTDTNLGVRYSLISDVIAGSVFGMQFIVTNDGLQNATNVVRTLKIRSNNGTPVNVVTPAGATVTNTGSGNSVSPRITTLTFPSVGITSGSLAVVTLQFNTQVGQQSLLVEGSAYGSENDPTLNDNVQLLDIQVKA